MRSTRAALALAVAISAGTALLWPAPSPAIVGGETSPPSANAFMASLHRPSGSAFCGGSVIAPGWVLTAAHCVDGKDTSDLFVVTGRHDLSDTSTGQRHGLFAIFVHPDYERLTYDAALLLLDSLTVSPAIRLATEADDDLEAAGTPVKVAGWGDTLPTMGLFSSRQLREVDLEVVSDAECGQTNFGFDAETGICASGLLKDSCTGDSGGPLYATRAGSEVQLGVVSYGTSCALPKFPGVYSEVNNTEIRDWIGALTGV